MRTLQMILPAALLLTGGVAFAQEGDARYTLERSGEGYVRMDKRTGEMSICSEQSGQLVCKLAADERSAFESDVDRLQASVESLEKRVTELEKTRQSYLPSDEQVDQSVETMEKFLRGFMGIVKEFDQDMSEPLPDRT